MVDRICSFVRVATTLNFATIKALNLQSPKSVNLKNDEISSRILIVISL